VPPSHVKGFNNMAVTADTAASSDDADQALEEVHNVVDQTAQSEMQPLDQLIFTSKSRCTGRSCDRQDVDTTAQKPTKIATPAGDEAKPEKLQLMKTGTPKTK
jgi:hypothetical protein